MSIQNRWVCVMMHCVICPYNREGCEHTSVCVGGGGGVLLLCFQTNLLVGDHTNWCTLV